jgi:hypothetical protein
VLTKPPGKRITNNSQQIQKANLHLTIFLLLPFENLSFFLTDIKRICSPSANALVLRLCPSDWKKRRKRTYSELMFDQGINEKCLIPLQLLE